MEFEKRIYAAVFLTLSAGTGLFMGIWVLSGSLWSDALSTDPNSVFLGYFCGPLWIITALLSLMGALACLLGDKWQMAMVGSVASFVSGFVILGLLAIVLVFQAKGEFLSEATRMGK